MNSKKVFGTLVIMGGLISAGDLGMHIVKPSADNITNVKEADIKETQQRQNSLNHHFSGITIHSIVPNSIQINNNQHKISFLADINNKMRKINFDTEMLNVRIDNNDDTYTYQVQPTNNGYSNIISVPDKIANQIKN